MKFCPNCGNELRKGSIFCDKCGNPVSDNTNDKSNINKISNESISKDIASKVDLISIVTGVFVSVILVVISLSRYSLPLGMIGIVMGGAISGFLTNNSTLYAIIYGAIVGFISSFLLYFSVPNITICMLLGVFGGFVGKVAKSNRK